MELSPVYLNQLGLLCSLGDSHSDVLAALTKPGKNYLTSSTKFFKPGAYVGLIQNELPDLADQPEHFKSRNNQILMAAFSQIKEAYQSLSKGVDAAKIGVVLGSSTSGISEGEKAIKHWVEEGSLPADFDYRRQEISAPAITLAEWSGAKGPCYTISTACSSGAKALASAKRLIQSGICDIVLAGGVDSLAGLTVNGFDSLDSISKGRCNPFSQNRDGINIGEGCGLFIVSRFPASVQLTGCGESSDAHHISAPHPEGQGAQQAMDKALKNAGLNKNQIDYINLHGTGTEQNDLMESKAVHQLFGKDTLCSSTKALTGHTLGAAGAIEAGFAWLLLKYQSAQLPINLSDLIADPTLSDIRLVTEDDNQIDNINHIQSNSFAFGGNNISIILSSNS